MESRFSRESKPLPLALVIISMILVLFTIASLLRQPYGHHAKGKEAGRAVTGAR